MASIINFLKKIEYYLLFGLVFLMPLFILTVFVNPFATSKIALLFYGVALLLIVKALKLIISGKLEFSAGNFDVPVLLIGLSYLLALIFKTPNKMEALLSPGTATLVLLGCLLYFLINQLKNNQKWELGSVLVISGAIFSIVSILSAVGVFTTVQSLPAFVRSVYFNPEGGLLPASIFLASMLPLATGSLLLAKNSVKKLIYGLAAIFIASALFANIYNMLPGKPASPIFPDFKTSWAITIDTLKESPLLGAGPGNYLTSFNRYRPIVFNQSKLWSVKFSTASDFFLTHITETGLLGLSAVVILLYSIYKNAKKDIKEKALVKWGFAGYAHLTFSLVLITAFIFFPASLLPIVMFFISLAFINKTTPSTINLTLEGPSPTKTFASRLPAFMIAIPVMAIIGYLTFRSFSVVAAEYYFKKSLDALAANDATKTNELMRKAITNNPYVDRYRTTMSRVYLIFANAVAQRASSAATKNKAETPATLSDKDRNDITTFVQIAISEAKATVALNPTRASNWEVLADTYRSIMPLAKGVDTFALQSYRSAVALDPINTNLRIALGSIYFSQKKYDEAVRVYELAVATKPDHANAHYNLAFAYKETGETDRAIEQMALVLSLLDQNSKDYEVARGALEDLQAKKLTEGKEGQELTIPSQKEPAINPQVELPQGNEPPESPLSPTPTPAAEAESPSPTAQ